MEVTYRWHIKAEDETVGGFAFNMVEALADYDGTMFDLLRSGDYRLLLMRKESRKWAFAQHAVAGVMMEHGKLVLPEMFTRSDGTFVKIPQRFYRELAVWAAACDRETRVCEGLDNNLRKSCCCNDIEVVRVEGDQSGNELPTRIVLRKGNRFAEYLIGQQGVDDARPEIVAG